MSCCCFNICCVLPQSKKYFSSKRQPNYKSVQSDIYKSAKSWMKYLKDDILVSEVNIPGTHDTLSIYPYYGLSVTICQKWKLIDQLNCGLRFFDIRVKQDIDGELPIFHNTSFQNAYLEQDIIDICDQFLTDNPTEFIILMIRVETKDINAPSLSNGFDKIIEKKRKDLFAFDNWVPSVHTIRSKIWIWPGVNWNYKGFSIRSKQRMGWLIRQDFYDYSIPDKKKAVQETNQLAIKNKHLRASGAQVYINQINGVKWYQWPSVYASEMNKFVYENELFEGIVVFDFPGEQLIKKLIESNFIKNKQQVAYKMIQMNEYPNTIKS